MVNQHRWLVLIFAFYVLLAVGYSLLMPIWEAPDEGAHYHLAWYLAHKDEYAPPEKNYEAHQARLFYYVGSWVLRGLDQINPEFAIYYFPEEQKYNIRIPERRFEWTDQNYRLILGVYVLRWINILFGGIALWLNWKTFNRIAPAQPALRLGALALAGLTPQYLHIMSSVNNDALGTLAGALLFYLAIRFVREGTVRLGLLIILLAILLPVITKLTVLPISAALFVIVIGKWLFSFSQKRWLFYVGLSILLGAGIVYLLFPEIVRSAWNEVEWRLFSLRKEALTAEYLKKISSQLLWTYWGKVGWLAVGLPFGVVQFLTAFALTGLALHAFRLVRSGFDDPQLDLWLATGLIALFTVLAVFRNGLTTYAAQGRLLFPASGALSLLMAAGWHGVISPRVRRYFPALILLFFLACNLGLWLAGVLPNYYQPFLD